MSSAGRSTWIDLKTGLEWQVDSPGVMTWHAAMAYAEGLSLNGHEDWRIPACLELEGLLDRTQYRPKMRKAVPFRDTRAYWSSSTFGRHKNSAWIGNFEGAYILSYYKTNRYHTRCVRGQIVTPG